MRILEWYRIDIAGGLHRPLVLAAVSMGAGSAIIGLSFLTRQPGPVRVAAAIVAFCAIVMGPVLAFLGLRGSLRDDRYLAVLPEGVLLHLEHERLLPWDDIERVRFDAAENAIVFALRDESTCVVAVRFIGTSNAALAERLDTARRKAGFHLLAQ